MDRAFLDANVLFSASLSSESRLSRLWRISDCRLLSSDYALREAQRNLAAKHREALSALANLSVALEMVIVPDSVGLSKAIRLDVADRPILAAAIHGRATHLLTGDKHDFGHLMGSLVEGVAIMLPGDYLAYRSKARRSS
ncbi:MAG: PIN domain-containing protein [Candidatus Binataceae bacterium]